MNKYILITGGTGFIGSHTSLVLLKNGYRLIVIDSLVNSSHKVIEKIIELAKIENKSCDNLVKFFQGDIRDEDFVNGVFKKYTNKNKRIDAVIHFAGLKSVFESTKLPLKYWDSNVNGTINLLNIMQRYGCFNFVFSSSATIYDVESTKNNLIKESSKINPINPYGQTKLTIEKILDDLFAVDESKWRLAILRYFNPIGAHVSGCIGENTSKNPSNIMPILIKVASGKIRNLEIFGNDWQTIDGTGVRDYVHVMDLAEGHLLALESLLNQKSHIIKLNLGTGIGTSVLKLVQTFESVNNVKIPYEFVSRRIGDSAYSVADCSLAKLKLNWNPSYNIQDMCKDSWNWFKKNPNGG